LPLVEHYVRELLDIKEISMTYSPGYASTKAFDEALQASRPRDLASGRTEHGPHRADLKIKIDSINIAERVSRGQQKLLVYALSLAQMKYLEEVTGKEAVLLLDDLTAELDLAHTRRLLDLLSSEFGQVFITTANTDTLPEDCFEHEKMFHVEQGNINEVELV
jgi:DNA replication and repair protein RecF